MAPEAVRDALVKQTVRAPDDSQTDSRHRTTPVGRLKKRKTSSTVDNVRVQPTYFPNHSGGEQALESHKRIHYESTPRTSEQLLSVCSSSDLDRIIDMLTPNSAAQYVTASYAATSYVLGPSSTAVPAALIVVVAF